MLRYGFLTGAAFTALCCLAHTQNVSVSGSNVVFPMKIDNKVGKSARLVLTGTALRTKYFFSIYAVGSYLEEGVRVRSAAELAKQDAVKQLHLVMERDLSGETVASTLAESIRANYPAPAFEAELRQLTAKLRAISVRQGDRLWLTHVPGRGFYAHLNGAEQVHIANPDFSRTIWDIYLGPVNLGESIKLGLVSRI